MQKLTHLSYGKIHGLSGANVATIGRTPTPLIENSGFISAKPKWLAHDSPVRKRVVALAADPMRMRLRLNSGVTGSGEAACGKYNIVEQGSIRSLTLVVSGTEALTKDVMAIIHSGEESASAAFEGMKPEE